MKYRNLFFDLDDTIWAFSRNARDTFEEVYRKYSFERYFDSFDHYYTIYQQRNTELWIEYGEGKITKDELNRQRFSYLEAVGRTGCGIAPWLELGEDDTPEGQLRKKYIELTVKGISNAVNPSSPDYLIFGEPSQPLVDAAFLAEGLLRAPKQLWGNLSPAARKQVVTELKRSRVIKPNESNWLLFASIVEAALQEFTGECDTTRLNYGIRKFRDL